MEPPIFCDECPKLAMAVLDHARLCADCLLAAVRGRDESWVKAHLAPLELHASPKKASVPGRKQGGDVEQVA
ncbi:MAG: hypothetical protein PHU25_03810 [Deltaproteobacteria bacterium]|nr:hypothetical protein [Deltaproteobacteria bacterium]